MNLADYDKKHNTHLEHQVNSLRLQAKLLKAFDGEQRLALVAENFENLSVEQAYTLLNPLLFRQEVEEAQAFKKRAAFFHFGRTILGLAPLIVTWASISWAVMEYGHYVDTHPKGTIPNFLQLWQQGLPGDNLTFFLTGVIDVCLLVLFLLFSVFSVRQEYSARKASESFAISLKNTVNDLVKVVAEHGINGVTSDTEIERIMRFVKMAINESTQDLQDVITEVKDAMLKSHQQLEDMFTNQITPLLTTFNNSMQSFSGDLTKLSNRVKDIASASSSMATSSQTMAQSASDLASNVQAQTTISKDIDTHITALNTTEQNLSREIQQVGTSMNGAASNVAGAANNMKTATQGMIQVGQQLIHIDANMVSALANQIRTIIHESNTVATNLNATNSNLQTTIQELQTLVKAIKVKRRKKFLFF
jgi:methyl-accepting chemotaxis protein